MAAARKHDRLLQIGDELRQIGDELGRAAESNDEIPVAGALERGDGHLGARRRGQELPVAVDVPILVEPSAEARPLELRGVEFDVRIGQPRG